MIKIIRNCSPLVVVACILLAIQLAGCGEDEDENEDEIDMDASEAPPLPPDESMNVNMSLFEENVVGAPAAATLSMKNFAYAVTAASTVSAAVVAAITPPATLFAAARATEPVEQEDGSWVWDFSVKISGVTFAATLTGVEKLSGNSWSMVVSTDAPMRPVTDFQWYTGESNTRNLSGLWQFYDLKTPDEQNPTVKIDWGVELAEEKVDLILENVDTRNDSKHASDALQYSAVLDAASASLKSASMTFTDASESETWEILWDETGAGSVTAPNYSSGEKACWDADKKDVDCN